MPELLSITARLRESSANWLKNARWVAIAWIVVFWRLGFAALLDPDEAHYAQITREMLQSHSWLVPLLDGRPYIDKPVLFHWLQGLCMVLFGQNEFAARLPSALAAIALVASTRALGIALFGAEVGEWGAVMLATIPATFALSSIGLFDMVLAAFLFGAVGCLMIAARDERPQLEKLGYVLLAFAVMTKGPVALILVALFLGAMWLAGGELRRRVRRLHWASGLLVAAVAASPWFVWMHGRFGSEFVQGYVLAGNIFYLTQPASYSSRAVSHTFYLRAFAGAFFPWTIVMIGRAIDLLRRRTARWSADEQVLWIWALVVIGFFSIARFKLDHYIYPAAPACCLIAARAWREAALDRSGAVLGTRASVLLLGGLLIVGGTFASTAIFEIDLELPRTAIALPLVLVAGGIAALAASARIGWQVPRAPAALAGMMVAAYCVIVAVGLPTLDRVRPTALVGRTVRQMTAADTPIGIYRLEQWRASLRYYSERPLARLDTREDVAAFVSPDRPVYVIMTRRDYRELRQLGVQLREVFKCRAVVGTTRTRIGLRRQQWDDLVVVTDAPERGRGRLRP